MKDHLDKNIKSLLELAPDQDPCPKDVQDRIFADIQSKLKEDDTPETKPALTLWKRPLLWAAAACFVAAIVIVALQQPKSTDPATVVDNGLAPAGNPAPSSILESLTATATMIQYKLADGSVLDIQPNSHVDVVKTDGPRPLIRLTKGSVTCDVVKHKGEFRVETAVGNAIALGTKYSVTLDESGPTPAMSVVVMEGTVLVTEKGGGDQVAVAGETICVGGKQPTQELVENWRSGQLVPKLDTGEQGDPMEVRRHTVKVDITDQIALVQVDQTFYNPSDQRVEGTFFFPLPHNSTICRLAMYVGDNLMEGEIAEAQRARRTFEALKVQQIDPALLEWAGGNNFKMRVFPIEPKSEKRVLISYFQVLKRDEFQRVRFSYPLVSDSLQTHPVGEIKVDVAINSTPDLIHLETPNYEAKTVLKTNEATVSYAASKAAPTNDFVAQYSVATGQPEVVVVPYWHAPRNEGYYMMLFSPEFDRQAATTSAEKANQFVFVLDKSGDLGNRHLKLGVKAVTTALSMLQPEDRFTIIAYDAISEVFGGGVQPASSATIQAATTWLNGLRAFGASDMSTVWPTLKNLAGDTDTVVIYAGSGMSTLTTTKSSKLLASAKTSLAGAEVRIHTLPIGTTKDKAFLENLARAFSGTCRPLSDGDDALMVVPELMNDFNWPIYRDIAVTVEGVETHSVYPREFPNIPAGRQFLAFGMYTEPGDAKLTLSANCQGERLDKTYAVQFTEKKGPRYVPKLWATRTIEDLQDNAALSTADESKTIVRQVVEVSKRFRVMSHFTSFLVLESPEEYLRYGIERRPDEFEGTLDFTVAGMTSSNPKVDLASKRKNQSGDLGWNSKPTSTLSKTSSTDGSTINGLPVAQLETDGYLGGRTNGGRKQAVAHYGGSSSVTRDEFSAGDPGAPQLTVMFDAEAVNSSIESSANGLEYAAAKSRGRKLADIDTLAWNRMELFPTFSRNALGKWPKRQVHSNTNALKTLHAMGNAVQTMQVVMTEYSVDRSGKASATGRPLSLAFDRKANRMSSHRKGHDQWTVCDGETIAQIFPLLKYAAHRTVDKEDLLKLASDLPALMMPWAEKLDRNYVISIHSTSKKETVLKFQNRNSKSTYTLLYLATSTGPVSKVERYDIPNPKKGPRLLETIYCENVKDFGGVTLPTLFKTVTWSSDPRPNDISYTLDGKKTSIQVKTPADLNKAKETLAKLVVGNADKTVCDGIAKQIAQASVAFQKVTRIVTLTNLKVNVVLDDSIFSVTVPTDYAVRDLDPQPTTTTPVRR